SKIEHRGEALREELFGLGVIQKPAEIDPFCHQDPARIPRAAEVIGDPIPRHVGSKQKSAAKRDLARSFAKHSRTGLQVGARQKAARNSRPDKNNSPRMKEEACEQTCDGPQS